MTVFRIRNCVCAVSYAFATVLSISGCFVDNQHLVTNGSSSGSSEPTTGSDTDPDPTTDTTQTPTTAGSESELDSETETETETESETEPECPVGTLGCPCASPDNPCINDLLCASEICVEPGICGNSVLEDNEQCDDGNAIDGDGCNNDCAPSGQTVWDSVVDGPSSQSDRAHDVAIGADGSVYVAGEITIVGAGTNAWVRKYTPGGGVSWTTTFNGTDNLDDAALGIAVDPNGSVVVVGYTTVGDTREAWAHRYLTDDGSPAWANALTYGEGVAYAIAADTDGSAYIAGSGSSLLNLTGLDALILRIDPIGGVVWETDFQDAEAGDDEFYDVAIGPTHVIACGYNSSNDDDTKIHAFDRVNGDTVSTAPGFDGGGSDRAVACTVTNTGRILALSADRDNDIDIGYTLLEFGPNLALDSQLYVTDRRAGEIAHDPTTGDIFVSGSTISDGQFSDLFVRRAPLTNPAEEHWQFLYDGPAHGEDHASAIARNPLGGVAAVGWVAVADQGLDVWVMRFSP